MDRQPQFEARAISNPAPAMAPGGLDSTLDKLPVIHQGNPIVPPLPAPLLAQEPSPGVWDVVWLGHESFQVQGPDFAICPDVAGATLAEREANAYLLAGAKGTLGALRGLMAQLGTMADQYNELADRMPIEYDIFNEILQQQPCINARAAIAAATPPVGVLSPNETAAWIETQGRADGGEEFLSRLAYAGGYQSILSDPAKLAQFSDELDSLIVARMINVRNALRWLGWQPAQGSEGMHPPLCKGGTHLQMDAERIPSASWNAGSYSISLRKAGVREPIARFGTDLFQERASRLAERIDAAARRQDEGAMSREELVSDPNLVGTFIERCAGDPLADILVALDHQLSTDSDLDSVTGSAKYEELRRGIRDAMAQHLDSTGFRRS